MQKHLMAETAIIASVGEIHADDIQTKLGEVEKLLLITSVVAKSRDGAELVGDIGTVISMVCETLGHMQKELAAACEMDYQTLYLHQRFLEARERYEVECRENEDAFGDTPIALDLDEAERAFVGYRPLTLGGAQHKARAVLSDEGLMNTLMTSRNGADLRLFLSSLANAEVGTIQ